MRECGETNLRARISTSARGRRQGLRRVKSKELGVRGEREASEGKPRVPKSVYVLFAATNVFFLFFFLFRFALLCSSIYFRSSVRCYSISFLFVCLEFILSFLFFPRDRTSPDSRSRLRMQVRGRTHAHEESSVESVKR